MIEDSSEGGLHPSDLPGWEPPADCFKGMRHLFIWIGDEDEHWVRAELIDMGVCPGPFDPERREFYDAHVPEWAMDNLDEQWGRWIWGPASGLAYTTDEG